MKAQHKEDNIFKKMCMEITKEVTAPSTVVKQWYVNTFSGQKATPVLTFREIGKHSIM